MSVEFDLQTKGGEEWNGCKTLDLFSVKAGGLLASIVDDANIGMNMQAVSIIDHITEPRDVDDYYVKELPCSTTPNQWGLFRKWPSGNDALLGCTTTGQGASNLLEYLKASAKEHRKN